MITMKIHSVIGIAFLTMCGLCAGTDPAFAQRGKFRWFKGNKPASSHRVVSPVKSPGRGRISVVQVKDELPRYEIPIRPKVAKHTLKRFQLARAPLNKAVHATFRAYPQSTLRENVFSGTLFRTTYQGQEEVYGVIATHALAPVPADILTYMYGNSSLHREFEIEVYTTDNTWISIPAEVVQLGAFSMGDLSLVKLKGPYDKSKLYFFPFAQKEVAESEVLSSLGFTSQHMVYQPERYVLQKSALSLRTSLAGACDEDLRGICGGPVFTPRAELILVHTGSKISPLPDMSRIGYGTYTWFLDKLVEAYHQAGEAFIPFELGGHHVADLRVDEYVSEISFWNEEQDKIWQVQVDGKFSFSTVEKWLRLLPVRSVELVIGRMEWGGKDNMFLNFQQEVRREHYDFGDDFLSVSDL